MEIRALVPKSIRARIVLFFVTMFAAVQLLTLWIVSDANSRLANSHMTTELDHGARVLRRLLDDRSDRLQQATRVLVADFAFRKTVASGDPATMQSALDNHGSRVGADAGFVISENKKMTAAFGIPANLPPAAQAAIAQTAEAYEDKTWILPIEGRLMQFIVAPILMPDPNGWAAFGFALDDRVAVDLKKLTDLEITFVGRDAAGTQTVVASTAPANLRLQVSSLEALASNNLRSSGVQLGSDAYLATRGAFDQNSEGNAAWIIHKSVAQTTEPFKKIALVLTLVSALGALTAAVGSVWLARRITQPIQMLTEATNRIRRGESDVQIPNDLSGEVGELATGFQQMSAEITQREHEISRLAFVDALTGKSNRTGFLRACEQAQQRSSDTQCLAIAVFDIARMQHINSRLGYGVGDAVIVGVANRLAEYAQSDEIIARTQGDHFAWLVNGPAPQSIETRLRSVIDELAQRPIPFGDQSVDIQLHAGWASSRTKTEDINVLFRCAEMALDIAVARQVSPIRYDTSMAVDAAPRLNLLSELKRAADNHEFVQHYQPKLAMDGRPTGVEALVRWNHPARGLLAPQTFIEFAENTGNIRAITRATLRDAIAQSKAWREQGFEVPIAVNISARDLQDESFLVYVSELVDSCNVAPELLKFEITERALLDNFDAAERALAHFNSVGIDVSLDDYGTGYAALTHLSKLQVSELKIDSSFIQGLANSPRNFAIVQSTAEMAHRLGIRVVAEGIESADDLTALRRTQCDEVQGYLFSKPLTADALTHWWKAKIAAHAAISRAADSQRHRDDSQ
jgi:diguanylate cyclase